MSSITDCRMRDMFQDMKISLSEGEEKAFRKLFDALFPKLSQFAFSLVKSHDVAKEIVDEIFIRLWNNRANIPQIDNILIYLYKATKNAALNHLSRSAFKNMHEPFDEIEIELKDEQDPESLMITREMHHLIRKAIDALPPRCKMVFKLVREDGLKYKEVAEVLNISVKTVDAQMVIAVGQIKQKMQVHLNFRATRVFSKK